MSIFKKIWKVHDSAPAEFFKLNKDLSPTAAQLLWNRNLRKGQEIEEFLNPDYDNNLHDAFLLKNMQKASRRILQAGDKKQKVVIYGDYDVDGVASTTILAEALEELGIKPKIFIPDRNKEGYGLNMDAVKKLTKDKINLLITIDCGTTNVEEIKYAKKQGVDVIVIDHHKTADTLPDAIVVNPHQKGDKYPFKGLCATALAFKTAQAILGSLNNPRIDPQQLKWQLDLVALATVADVMPLLGENRVFVKYGLMVLQKTKRQGLKVLLENSNSKKIDTRTLGFILAPRINAAGRMHHANLAFDLLRATDRQKAQELAQELEQYNKQRQKLVIDIMTEIEENNFENKSAIVAGSKKWPVGVLGIAAGRLAEKYSKPAFLYQKFNDHLKGSARTPEPFDTVEILAQAQKHLHRFGGHAQAGGFKGSLESEKDFLDTIESYVSAQKISASPTLYADCEVALSQLNWDLHSQIEKLEPFGQDNAEPVFAARNVEIKNIQKVGQNLNHFKCTLAQENNNMAAIGFYFGDNADSIKNNDKIDVMFELIPNEFNGQKKLDLKLIDIKKNNDNHNNDNDKNKMP